MRSRKTASSKANSSKTDRDDLSKRQKTHPNTESKDEAESSGNQHLCSGCRKSIKREKFYLKACEKFWHEECLKCDKCQAKLGELGSSLYCKSNMHLCRQDYLNLFGTTGVCSVCDKLIRGYEMVMRAKNNVYHLECFACQLCNLRFCVGERFYLCENKIVCQYDYEEHILPIERSLIEVANSNALGAAEHSDKTSSVVEA